MVTSAQTTLFPTPVHNVGLFSSHWLDHRLALEPEWLDVQSEASGASNTRPLHRPPPRGRSEQHPARRPLRGVGQGAAPDLQEPCGSGWRILWKQHLPRIKLSPRPSLRLRMRLVFVLSVDAE
jgi:hypothetical protein